MYYATIAIYCQLLRKMFLKTKRGVSDVNSVKLCIFPKKSAAIQQIIVYAVASTNHHTVALTSW